MRNFFQSEASLEAFGWGDTLYGGSSNDQLLGGDGDDTQTGGEGSDTLQGGEGADTYKFGSSTPGGAGGYWGKDTITDSDGKGSLQIDGQTLQGTFTSFGERGAYRLKLADGTGAGLSVYNDTASSTGKSAILKFSSNLTNQITIRNFDETAAKGSQGFIGMKIDPKMNVLVAASSSTAGSPFEAWNFNPSTFAAGAPKEDAPFAANSIALCTDSIWAKYSKRFKNRRENNPKTRNCEIFKRNRPLAFIESAQGAMVFVVNTGGAYNACEVQHG